MNIELIRRKLEKESILFSDENLLNKPTVIGYEKKFRWRWIGTQLNTFIVATDFGDQRITKPIIESHLTESFNYAKKNYRGWPRGFQSALGVVSILISTQVDSESKEFCKELRSNKKWAGFLIPVVVDSSEKDISAFERIPIWGFIYYTHFKELINRIC